ncbi:Aspartate aminotransferase, cytoplasmic [Thelohanellus kitauei]|uniref:aspartate transaminase n=1 Tax=Thelohanellus kitauei TaxID=669202 RepID=A0A0C2NJ20_THEKT|nr:Aspartate aminotransferase, cytoplasmic [Thelohanellus kitauei]
MDPTVEQWDVICQKLIDKKLIPLFDVAYLGLASGCFETDAYPIRLLSSRGKEMIICVSFSKNMGLYSQRVLISDERVGKHVFYPPNHGASVAEKILNNEKYFEEWKTEVESMYKRISEMRSGLAKRLLELKTPGDWSFLTRQRGLFSYTGLNKEQIEYMEKEHGIFMPTSGRINVSGLTVECLDHVAKAIHDAATRFPKHLNK